MIRFLVLATLAIVIGTSFRSTHSINPDSSVTAKGKWKSLFDGTSYKGWHLYGRQTVGTCWKIEDKALHLVPVPEKPNRGDLVTDEEFKNFELELEWKVAAGSNSGIIFLVHEDTAQFRETYVTGLEMQVLDNIGASDNKKENHLAGSLYDLLGSAATSQPKPVGEWNKCRIVCNKAKLDLYLNGKMTASTTLWDDNWKKLVEGSKFKTMSGFGAYQQGKIALQYHGGEAWFRNIRIRSLD